MEIGIIGAGQIGGTLARKLGESGHTIKIANSRSPESLAEFNAEAGVSAVSLVDVTKDVQVVIVSIPEKRVLDLPKTLFDKVSQNVIIIDTGNFYPFRDGRIELIENGMIECRWVEKRLGRPVLKAFNNIMAYSLANGGLPKGTPGRIALPAAGDDTQSIETTIRLMDDIGFDGINAGGIDESWRQQPGAPVYCTDLDAKALLKALAKTTDVGKSRLPELRDIALERISQLGAGAEPRDIVNLTRLLFGSISP